MSIGSKIKSLRNSKGMSQNDLAEAIGVSRQAITKWETDSGVPEIDNLIAISDTLEIDVDSLVRDNMSQYSSLIQYDIDSGKDFEIELVPSNRLIIEGTDSEKIRIEMLSERIPSLDSDLKVAIEDRKRRMEIRMYRRNDLTETLCRKELTVRIRLPRKFIEEIELRADVNKMCLSGFDTKDFEFDGEADFVMIDDVHGRAEMDVRTDCIFRIASLDGSVEINQNGRNSRVEIKPDVGFRAVNAGRKCELNIAEGLSVDEGCEDTIELNGMKSRLDIVSF